MKSDHDALPTELWSHTLGARSIYCFIAQWVEHRTGIRGGHGFESRWSPDFFRLLLSSYLPPFSLICDFRKQNTRGNVSKISVNHTCYRQIGLKSTNHSPIAWRKQGLKVTLVAVIGGSDLSITRKNNGKFGNVSAGVLFSKVAWVNWEIYCDDPFTFIYNRSTNMNYFIYTSQLYLRITTWCGANIY